MPVLPACLPMTPHLKFPLRTFDIFSFDQMGFEVKSLFLSLFLYGYRICFFFFLFDHSCELSYNVISPTPYNTLIHKWWLNGLKKQWENNMSFLTLMVIPGVLLHQSLLHRSFGRPSSCHRAHAHWCIRSSGIRWERHTCLLTFELVGYPRHMSERKHVFSSSWIPTFYYTMIFEISGGRKKKRRERI